MNRRIAGVFAGFIIAFTVMQPAQAWQADMHYGMTFFLAYHAGFSEADAMAIARGNIGMDHPPRDAVTKMARLLVHPGWASRPEELSRQIRRDHFFSTTDVPANPCDRKVTPGEPSRERVRSADSLTDLGKALHAFQDSWSHAGVPSTLLPWRRNLQWSHPDTRNGHTGEPDCENGAPTRIGLSSDADLTYLHANEALNEVLKNSYRELVAMDLPREREPAAWDDIVDAAEACVLARTQIDKLKHCFTFNGGYIDHAVSYARGLSLPAGDGFWQVLRNQEKSGLAEKSVISIEAIAVVAPRIEGEVDADIARRIGNRLGALIAPKSTESIEKDGMSWHEASGMPPIEAGERQLIADFMQPLATSSADKNKEAFPAEGIPMHLDDITAIEQDGPYTLYRLNEPERHGHGGYAVGFRLRNKINEAIILFFDETEQRFTERTILVN